MTFLLIFLFWWALVFIHNISPLILPNPINVLNQLYAHKSLLFYHSFITILPLILGVCIGFVMGFITATYAYYKNAHSGHMSKIVLIVQGVPSFIIMPILIIWLGNSIWSKSLMVGIWSFFTIYASLLSGFQSLPKPLQNLKKTYHLSFYESFKSIDFYNSLPALLTGIKIAMAHAPLTVLAAEWFGSDQGLGYLLMIYFAQLNMEMVFAIVCVLVTLVMTLNIIGRKTHEKVIFWA